MFQVFLNITFITRTHGFVYVTVQGFYQERGLNISELQEAHLIFRGAECILHTVVYFIFSHNAAIKYLSDCMSK